MHCPKTLTWSKQRIVHCSTQHSGLKQLVHMASAELRLLTESAQTPALEAVGGRFSFDRDQKSGYHQARPCSVNRVGIEYISPCIDLNLSF